MVLQEKHKEFAVKNFAYFMTRAEVVEVFIEEFADDLPEPPPMPELPYTEASYNNNRSIEDRLAREKFTSENLAKYGDQYEETYGNDASIKFEQDKKEILAEIKLAYHRKYNFAEAKRRHLDKHQSRLKNHNIKVKRNLSDQFRRFHINHRQFPAKYRPLFNRVRKQYFMSYQSEPLKQAENLLFELETLYGYVKDRIFKADNPKEVMKHLDLAHNILKTIITYSAVDAKQDVVDVTPQKKALQDKHSD